MNKIAKIVFISLFSFTATIKPFASTKQYLPSFISATYADPGEGLPVISDDQVNNLIEYCKEETEKTDEECENEVTQQNINDDEVLEVTPKHLRLRKKHLDPHERKRMAKNISQNV